VTLHLSQPTLMLWVFAVLVAAWLCLPAVLGFLGLSRLRLWGEENPATADPPADDEQYRLFASQLTAAGLELVGPGGTRFWFFCGRWCMTSCKWVFATPERDCYVCLSRKSSDEPLRVAFLTGLSDGTLIESVNRMESLVIVEPQYVRWGYATQFLGELLDLHRQVAERVRAKAGAAITRHDLASILALDQRHGARQLQKFGPQSGVTAFFFAGVGTGVPAVWADFLFGHWHWAVPLAAVAGGLAQAAFMPYFYRHFARIAAQNDATGTLMRRRTGLRGPGQTSQNTQVRNVATGVLARLGVTGVTNRAGEVSFRAPDDAFQGR
jgi:hypothetical protein